MKSNRITSAGHSSNTHVMRRFFVGQKVWFAEDTLPYIVMANNERFVICTRKLNKRKDADLLWFEVERGASWSFTSAYEALKDAPVYSIIDLQEGIRGTENLVFCMGFGNKKLCKEALKRLSNGESEISHRNRTTLQIRRVSPNAA